MDEKRGDEREETPGGDGYGATPTDKGNSENGKTPGETPGGPKRAKTAALADK